MQPSGEAEGQYEQAAQDSGEGEPVKTGIHAAAPLRRRAW